MTCYGPLLAMYHYLLRTITCYAPWLATDHYLLCTITCYVPLLATHHDLLRTMTWYAPWLATHHYLLCTITCYVPLLASYHYLLRTITCYEYVSLLATYHHLLSTITCYVPRHRKAVGLWNIAGRTRSGPLGELKCRARAAFRHEMKFLRENVDQLRSQSMQSKLQREECNDFWKEIKALNVKKESLPLTVGGTFKCNCKFCWLHWHPRCRS